ncbi:hypothetical protein [Candidatus Nitrosotenuis uzonensis]|uniref:Uncharacterized protein n=1 Tax=Candidatus Nitrosotenuis uzonensis TaxID=1407055 RepID=V6AR29_9ARCH|nr:hypothetical protein [Candidatus Nitrosotenuis uzonensis]CDI05010.1 exported hypothetical protein [Candidatus Nitrosotenuis uzonensis]
MTNKNIQFTSIAIVMAFVVGFSLVGIPEADAAAIDEKFVEYAKQYQDVKERKNTATGEEKIRLEQTEADLLAFLNKQGLPNDEQYKSNPSYWIDLRHTVLEREQKHDSVSQVDYSGDSQITLACGCTHGLKLKAGYSVYAWGIWWPHYASFFTEIGVGQNNYSLIYFNDPENDYVQPFQYTQSKTSGKTINYDWEYTAHDASYDLIASNTGGVNHYYPTTSSYFVVYSPTLNNVENGSEFKYSVEVNSIS